MRTSVDMILVLDNYDSFVHNLARYLRMLGQNTHVVRSDQITINEIRSLHPQAILISPGPKSPTEAGISLQVVRQLSGDIPILGICLGHQTIAAAFGAAIVTNEPMHGRESLIHHSSRGIFAETPSPLSVARYHSLIVDPQTVPEMLRVTATTADGIIMAIEHCQHPTVGLQFHPESILTEHGSTLIANFLRLAGLTPLAHDSIAPTAGIHSS